MRTWLKNQWLTLSLLLLIPLTAVAQNTGASFSTPNGQTVGGSAMLVPCGPLISGIPLMCPPGLMNPVPVNVTNGITAIGVIDAASTPVGGSIAVTNMFQSVMDLNASRKGCSIQNTGTNMMWFSIQGSPTKAGSEQVLPGNHFNCAVNNTPVVMPEAIQVTGTSGDTFQGNWQ